MGDTPPPPACLEIDIPIAANSPCDQSVAKEIADCTGTKPTANWNCAENLCCGYAIRYWAATDVGAGEGKCL